MTKINAAKVTENKTPRVSVVRKITESRLVSLFSLGFAAGSAGRLTGFEEGAYFATGGFLIADLFKRDLSQRGLGEYLIYGAGFATAYGDKILEVINPLLEK